jgi:nucleoside-diphosphate-sugar epimerase
VRILVLGGTRFIGRALVIELLGAGHTVAIVHRGQHEVDLPSEVQHIHTERRHLIAYRDELVKFSPDAVLDLSAMTASDAEVLDRAIDRSIPLVRSRAWMSTAPSHPYTQERSLTPSR